MNSPYLTENGAGDRDVHAGHFPARDPSDPFPEAGLGGAEAVHNRPRGVNGYVVIQRRDRQRGGDRHGHPSTSGRDLRGHTAAINIQRSSANLFYHLEDDSVVDDGPARLQGHLSGVSR
ncbi:hypothetical protein [Salinibacterium sp. TMP30]|uniref:hypothetical protein n=1 Tax=Salinibacterium sp. TMP30 TaxID=3138237 RepID=UPI00313A1DEE